MNKLIGIVLVAAGTAGLWFGGIPYRTNETVLKVGPLEAKADVDRTMEIPKPISAGAVGVGVVFLLLPGGRKKS
ncbi:MAG: hypothetical protein U0228_12725 [Myxococcaceae bacterium]